MRLQNEDFASLLEYREGRLFWRIKTCRKVVAGAEAGMTNTSHGYKTIGINCKRYYVHQIVFYLHHGYFPKCIDHLNRNKQDNRIENLREVTFSQNSQNINMRKNNKTGYRGISFNSKRKQYAVQKMINKESFFGGWFNKLEDAVECLNNFRSYK